MILQFWQFTQQESFVYIICLSCMLPLMILHLILCHFMLKFLFLTYNLRDCWLWAAKLLRNFSLGHLLWSWTFLSFWLSDKFLYLQLIVNRIKYDILAHGHYVTMINTNLKNTNLTEFIMILSGIWHYTL